MQRMPSRSLELLKDDLVVNLRNQIKKAKIGMIYHSRKISIFLKIQTNLRWFHRTGTRLKYCRAGSVQKLFTNFLLAKRSLIVIAELLLVFEINKYSFKKAEKYACHKNGTPKGKILQKPDTEMIIKTAVCQSVFFHYAEYDTNPKYY